MLSNVLYLVLRSRRGLGDAESWAFGELVLEKKQKPIENPDTL